MAYAVDPVSDPRIGTTLCSGKYRIHQPVRATSLGTLYRAEHVALQRVVDVRLMHGSHIQMDEKAAVRVHRYAQAAARIRHRNIVDVLDFGREPDGTLYLVSEWLEGVTLRSFVDQHSPLRLDIALALVDQILAGVAAAHRSGIIHRNLHPEAIMLVEETREDSVDGMAARVKIVDFDVAKMHETDDAHSPAQTIDMVAGIPEFMSPEQCNGHRPNEQSDEYACACIAYYICAGRPPFVDRSAVQVLHAHGNLPPPRLSDLRPDVPAAVSDVLLHALAKPADARFQSVREFRQALRHAQAKAADTRGKSRGATDRLQNMAWVLVAAALVWLTVRLVSQYLALSSH